MSAPTDFQHLLQILASEQQILQRTDQKALGILSVLGVVLVFFIVHVTQIPQGPLTFSIICLYLITAITALIALLRVIVPRVFHTNFTSAAGHRVNPAFFAGIAQFPSAEAYTKYLREILGDEAAVFDIFADSIYSLGRINAYKNRFLRIGMIAFIGAIFLELGVVIVVYARLALA